MLGLCVLKSKIFLSSAIVNIAMRILTFAVSDCELSKFAPTSLGFYFIQNFVMQTIDSF